MLSVSHTLRSLASMPHIVLGGTPRERAGEGLLLCHRLGADALPRIEVSSSAFSEGEPIPARFSVDGEGLSPPVRWAGLPDSAETLVLAVEDPDAPTPQPFVHLLAYNLSPMLGGLPEALVGEMPVALNGGAFGKNSMFRTGWAPCAPPRGDAPHHYHFQLFALSRTLQLEPRAGRSALLEAMRGGVLAFGELIGTYQR